MERELERQFRSALFERAVLSPPKVSPAVRQTHPEALSVFKDAYNLEFLGLPPVHAEADLHRGLLEQLRVFLIELGRDFCFVGSEYPVQVGGRDFALDLLFFHRGLNCLVAIELKVGEFEPEYLGKLNFYLSAVDDLYRNGPDAPTIGLLLCETNNSALAEYALRDVAKPIGVSTYRVTRELPGAIRDELPTVEDLQEVVTKLRSEMEQLRQERDE